MAFFAIEPYMGSPSVFLFFALFLPPYFAIADEPFSACEPFTCGNITDLSYPFWFDSRPEYCGHPKFKLNCQGDNATINMASQDFRVIDVNSTTRTLTIARMDLWGTKCPNEFNNFTLDYAVFNYTSNDVNSTMLYNCDPLVYTPPPVNLSTSLEFDCPAKGYPIEAYFLLISEKWFNWSALGCRVSIIVPVLGVAVKSFMEEAIDPGDVIDQGFEVEWEPTEGGLCNNCKISGGRCGYNISLEEFTCFCPNQSNYGVCVSDLLSGTPTQAPLLQPEPYPQEPAAPPQSMFPSSQLLVLS